MRKADQTGGPPAPRPGVSAMPFAGDDPGRSGAPDEPAAAIEPEPARGLADFAWPALSLGDRARRLAYRLGVPGSALTSPFARPERPRLLATVANPLPGSKSAGTALRAGYFLVHGLKLPIAQVDYAGTARLSPPAARLVHGFHWLADLEAAAPREQVSPLAEQLLGAWLAAHPAPPKRPNQAAWSIANSGHRLLGWLVHAPLILSGPDKALRARALTAMSQTARWLDRNAARGEDGLARVAGWSAVVAAGLLLPRGRARRLHGEAGLIAALGEALGDDGGVLSRSPIDQAEAIGLLVQLSACYQATRRDLPAPLQAICAMLVPPLLTVTHDDGALSSWQGGWAVSADAVAALIAASQIRARPLRQVRQWGYQRVAAGKSLVIFDAAPPPLARHARHGCASTLAIEFSHGGQRLIVNCGGAGAAGGAMPQRLEQGLRATAAHSALVLDNANSTAVLGNGRLGAGVSEVEIDRRVLAPGDGTRIGATRVEGSHDGYGKRYGLIHRRNLVLSDDGLELRGEDLLIPAKGKGRRGKVGFAMRFHLARGIEVEIAEDGRSAGIAPPDGSYWQFEAGCGGITAEDSIWADGQGRPVAIRQLVIQGLVLRSGGSFAWLLRKMG